MMHPHPLKPCNPLLHARYGPLLDSPPPRGIPAPILARVRELISRRNSAPEAEIEAIDAEIVGRTYWYVLRPDEIAQAIIGPRWRVSVAEATLILAACGEAGYPIGGNGAPDYAGCHPYAPTRGVERDRVIWAAAEYWARAATRPITYVSLGDSRGFLPRPVQYDQPGGMHPGQQAALTLGPASDIGDECDSAGYMRRHARRLLLVEGYR